MERYSRTQAMEGASGSRPVLDWIRYSGLTGLEEPMWKLGIGGGGEEPESYPERPEMMDCLYYLRTGFCGYGASCRFNHPRDRTAVTGATKNSRGDYPERAGQPVCQYYIKTGKCKFGSSCKYHHPGNGLPTPTTLSIYGYPLRPGKQECLYYVKTGQCKFGVTCKFHHPLPSGVQVVVPVPGQAQPPVQSSWQISSPALLSGSYVLGTYGPMLLQSGMISVPGWTSYTAPVSPAASANTQATQLSPSAPAYTGQYLSVSPSADHSISNTKESALPERPGMMDCIYYMKNGVCRYGASCRFHHPPNWTPSMANIALSPINFSLPLDAPTSSSTTTDLKPDSVPNKDTFLTRVSSVSASIGGGSVSSSSATTKSRSGSSSSSSSSSESHGNDDDVRDSS